MKAYLGSLLLLCWMVSGSMARAEDTSGVVVIDPAADQDGLPTINESWYTLWGVGLATMRYSRQMQRDVDALHDLPGVDTFSGTYDVFGFYWPLSGHKTMMGFVINGSYQTWDNKDVLLRLRHETYGFSAHHFWGPNIGSGWFARGDVGIAIAREDVERGHQAVSFSSGSGTGLLVGGGYGFALGRETRLLVNLNLSRRQIDSFVAHTWGLTTGFLF